MGLFGFSGIVCHMSSYASSCIILHCDIEKCCLCRPDHKELESRPFTAADQRRENLIKQLANEFCTVKHEGAPRSTNNSEESIMIRG
jgi:hypothetical protein